MKHLAYTLIILVFTCNIILGQETYDELPENLMIETVVFLEYEELYIDDDMMNSMKRLYKKRNEASTRANKELHAVVENYPFDYVISNRSEAKTWVEKGYKYVYECPIMTAYNDGQNMYTGASATYVAMMCLYDLETGDKYEVFKLKDNLSYHYKYIMNKLIGKAKKMY